MALIKCSNCGKEISDKAIMCPNCGVSCQVEEGGNKTSKVCLECGNLILEGQTECANCGCPIDVEKNTQKVEVTKISIGSKKKVITALICVAIIICIGFFASNSIKANNAQAYLDNLSGATAAMYLGAIEAEDLGALIHNVWKDAIYDDYNSETYKYTQGASDFNEALGNLFADKEFIKQCNGLEDNRDLVDSMMKELTNPPEEYKEAYSDVKRLYEVYVEFSNLALSPTGNLQSYTSSYNELEADFVKCYQAVELYLE